MTKTGLAFSGGGIRSAAFCSGVLRRLLEREVEVDYLSCVSGGGYTGTAYLDWKYREENKARMEGKEEDELRDWHDDFFANMKREAGYLCNWSNPFRGILDAIILSGLVLGVTIIQPIVIWGSYACPVAFIVDLIFGRLLRRESECNAVLATTTAKSRFEETGEINSSPSGESAAVQAIRENCLLQRGTLAFSLIVLFSLLFILFIAFYTLVRIKQVNKRFRPFLRMSQYIFFVLLALTFVPFAIHDFVSEIPLWAQFVVVPVFVIVWILLPILRKKTSYVLVIYLYSYSIYWRVYEEKLFGVAYSELLFNCLLFASGLSLWIIPIVASLHERLVHVYNRWRLQKAFYHKDSKGRTGCSGISFRDICPLWTCLKREKRESRLKSKPLTLADLRGMKPEYLCNMVVNRWKSQEHLKKYELLIMSPQGIERLDRDPSKKQFEGKLEPEDVMLSDAMATSAAALATRMGKYDRTIEGLTRLHTILGFNMGATMISDMKSVKRKSLALNLCLPSLVHIIRGIPLIVTPAFYYCNCAISPVTVGVISFFIIHFVLAFIALIDTGAEKPGFCEKLARWFIVHISFVYFVRQMFSKNNVGPMPPPILLLSDGGHVENLAILPLLNRRLPRIVVVDGGFKQDERFYGDSILDALMLARNKLGCSFLSVDGQDVISDLLQTFVKPRAGGRPRHYKFKVRYPRDEFGEESDGEILLIAPRQPQHGVSDGINGTVDVDLYPFDQPDGLHHGMVLKENDVSKLTLCCCECCHQTACYGLSKILCNVFPQHNTANQFFTSRLFSAYHREGYRSCVEAKADAFLMSFDVKTGPSGHDIVDV